MPDTFSPSQNPSGIIIIRKRKVETWVEITEKSLVKKMRSVNGKPEDGFETDGAANKELDRRFYHNKVAEQLDKYEDELESLRTEKETLQGEIRDLHNNYSKLQKRTDELEEEKKKVEKLINQLKKEKELSSLREQVRQDMTSDLDDFMGTYNWRCTWVVHELRNRQERLGEEKYTYTQITKLSKKAFEG